MQDFNEQDEHNLLQTMATAELSSTQPWKCTKNVAQATTPYQSLLPSLQEHKKKLFLVIY